MATSAVTKVTGLGSSAVGKMGSALGLGGRKGKEAAKGRAERERGEREGAAARGLEGSPPAEGDGAGAGEGLLKRCKWLELAGAPRATAARDRRV